jgi:hypothetical protein
MSNLPVPSDAGGSLSPRQTARASRALAKANMRVFSHGLDAQAKAEEDRQDTQAVADALRTALDEELGLLRDGLALAGRSPAAIELVARKVELLSNIDNRRISRRWG